MTTIVTTASRAAKLNPAITGGAIPSGHVRLRCGDPAFALVTLLGPEAPRLTGGVGGWNVVARPQAVGMTLWEGVEPYALSLSLMLDGWAAQRSQERALRGLLRVGRGDSESPPGVLIVEGIPLPAVRWVVEGIDYGDPILSPQDGRRLRQALTLSLRQYVPPRFLRRRRSAYGSSTKVAIMRAQRGDTPAKIAKRRRLKSWKVLRDLNRGLKLKANTKLKLGQKIRVPASKTQARFGGKDRR